MSKSHSSPFAIALILSLILTLNQTPAQNPLLTPFQHTGDAIVVDATTNQVWRFMDLDLDGDWNDAGEIALYFSTAPGITLGNPTNVAVGPDGSVYISDSTNDQIIRLRDLNGDGVATGTGEAIIFFSAAANASGVTMPSALGLTVSADGAVWVANSNTSTVGTDSIIRLADGTADLDAEDAGEAFEYATFAIGQSAGVSIPSNVVVGTDGTVYYVENGTGGKGIYRLHDDVVPNGFCTDPGEVTAFYLPAAPAPTPIPQYWGVAADRNGNFWMTDTAFDRILRVADLDVSLGIANGTGEEAVFFSAAAPSNMWQAAVASDGAVYVVEDASATNRDKIFRLVDLDSDGTATGSGESTVVYDDAAASVNLGSVRSIAFLKAPFIETTPNPVPIGIGASFTAQAGAFDFMNVWVSVLPDSLFAPPYGTVGISVTVPGAYFELIPVFPLDATGTWPIFVPVANDPMLLGATFYLQAIGGPPARLQLSNVEVITFF